MPLNTFYRINRFFFSSNMSCQPWWFSIHGVCLVHCFTSAFRQRNSKGDLIKTNSQKVLVRASYLTCETWNFDIENNWAQCLYTSDDVECYYCNKRNTIHIYICIVRTLYYKRHWNAGFDMIILYDRCFYFLAALSKWKVWFIFLK